MRLHTVHAQGLTARMESCQRPNMEAFVEWTARIVICAVGMAVVGALMLAWCLIVFLLSGRLPWMVRKYF